MTSARRQPTPQERRAQPREADIVAMPIPAQQPVHEREPQMQMERLGDILRRTRQRRGDELQPIADYLCIRRSFLEALEESRYESFPADAYVIGFLRSYAELLGLDGQEAIDRYRAEMAGRRKKPSLTLPTPIQEGRSPSVFVLIGAFVAAILIYAIWYGFSTSDRATVTIAPALPSAISDTTNNSASSANASSAAATPAETVAPAPVPQPAAPAPIAIETQPVQNPPTVTTPAPVQTPAAEAQDQAPPAAPVKPTHLIIKAQQSSWILIDDGKGETIFDRVLKPGETFQVPDKPSLMLTTGNGAGIVLTLDGVDLPKLAGRPSGIMRDIPLDTAHLKSMAPPKD